MRTVTVTVAGTSPYGPGKHVDSEKLPKESPDDFEKRTWKERAHYDGRGLAFIQPMAFKKALDTAVSRMGEKIKGRGQVTWTKFFIAGVIVVEPVPLGVKREDVKGQWLFVPSDGKRGGGTRVMRCFPMFEPWSGKVIFRILDETITKDIFERALIQAGGFVGIGTFRPEHGGFWGRFEVKEVRWS